MRNDTEAALSPAECRDLRRIAGLMIPPSDEFNVPGADDPVIFADIEKSLGRDLGAVRRAIAIVSAGSGSPLADLDDGQAEAALQRFLGSESAELAALGRALVQCYYRDDRVIRSLGLEPRAPFPRGHTLEQGDWSLLDPVRARPKLWRDAP